MLFSLHVDGWREGKAGCERLNGTAFRVPRGRKRGKQFGGLKIGGGVG